MSRTRSVQQRREAAAERRSRRAEVDDPAVVMEAAATFLSVRRRSVGETRTRLKDLGFPLRLCDEVVDRLTELGYLDDEAFAQAWIESRDRARPRGEIALRRELQLKGIPHDIISAALSDRAQAAVERAGADAEADGQAGDADTAAALRLVARRSGSLARESDPRKRRQKAYSLLARSGFAPDVCAAVANRVTANGDPDALESV